VRMFAENRETACQPGRDCSTSFDPVLPVTLCRRTLTVWHAARHARRGGAFRFANWACFVTQEHPGHEMSRESALAQRSLVQVLPLPTPSPP